MSALSYSGAERRQDRRTTLEALVYISFGSDNGGIVLNVSEGGLRFRALTPVPASKTMRFWFSAEGGRVDAEGEVAWTDETGKGGGLRFKALAPDAREQIRRWISQPTPALVTAPNPAPQPLLGSRNQAGQAVALDRVRSVEQRLHTQSVPRAWGTFSRGLVSGVVVSSLAGAAILLHLNRRQLGESLIQIGQRLAVKSPAMMSRESATNSLVASDDLSSPPTPGGSAKRARVKFAEPAVVISGISPTTSLPMVDIPRGSALLFREPAASPQPEPANATSNATPVLSPDPEDHPVSAAENAREADTNTAMFPKKYLEVSDFRQKAAADKTEEALGQLGFDVSVTRMGRLWMNSYHVLVGPYTNDDEAEAARNDLESHGFHPRSHARRSRRIVLPLLTLADTDIVLKNGIISWDANSSAATVSFVKAGNVVSKAQGRWVKRGVTYSVDAVVSTSSERGPLTLLEIQCHGMNRALVFDESKPVRYFVPPYRSGE